MQSLLGKNNADTDGSVGGLPFSRHGSLMSDSPDVLAQLQGKQTTNL
jgi:hypothetical protein